MCFFYYSHQNLAQSYSPTQTNENIFSVGSLKFVIKELSVTGNLALAEGAVRWDMMCRFIGYSSQAVN